MLTDKRRNEAYGAAVAEVVSTGRPFCTPLQAATVGCKKIYSPLLGTGQHILDIGTGTGLLAMLAAIQAKDLNAGNHACCTCVTNVNLPGCFLSCRKSLLSSMCFHVRKPGDYKCDSL